MRCDGCSKWTTARVTRYGSGAEIRTWSAPEEKGRCSVLDVDTPGGFGCTAFAPLLINGAHAHVVYTWKNGAPWQHWVPGPCPDCSGVGSTGGGACSRCVGVGKVQYHDDGYVSDNHTKMHPMERGHVEPLRCKTCRETVEVKWKACPMCGTRLEPPAETEVIGGFGNAGGAFQSNKAEHADNLRQEIDAMNEEDAKLAGLTPVADPAIARLLARIGS